MHCVRKWLLVAGCWFYNRQKQDISIERAKTSSEEHQTSNKQQTAVAKAVDSRKKLLDVRLRVRNHSYLRVIKVMYSYGNSGLRGQTRQTIRNWADRKIKHVLETNYN